jgi:hypothetical protein
MLKECKQSLRQSSIENRIAVAQRMDQLFHFGTIAVAQRMDQLFHFGTML